MSDKVDLTRTTQYQIGTITYQVSACFQESGATLKDLMLKLLRDEIRQNPVCNLASCPLDAV